MVPPLLPTSLPLYISLIFFLSPSFSPSSNSFLHTQKDYISYDNLEQISGIPAFKKYVIRRTKPFPEGVFYVDSSMAAFERGSEDTYKVGIHYSFHGTNTGPGFLGLPPTGNIYI
jgi:hypothetical protein